MDVTVPLLSPEEERALMGPHEAHARAVRNRFGVALDVRRGRVHIEGDEEEVSDAARAVRALLAHLRSEGSLDEKAVARLLENGAHAPGEPEEGRRTGLLPPGVEWRTPGQERFVRAIDRNTLTFAIGPAGTGKTFLAAAYAVAALRRGHFRKLVLVRPAVEAGEHLGFLPGDFAAKIDPYLRPLYDSLSAHLEPGKLKLFLETDVIEIAPLAYMRGRTLDEAFIILDEAQNTTIGQMKMFLTRMGRSSKVVVNGDTTQVDLPAHVRSGLLDAQPLLSNVAGIGMVMLEKKDIVRHPLVQKIVDAYEQRDRNELPEGFGAQVIAVANRQRRVAVSSAQVRAVVAAAFAQERAGEPDVSVALVDDATIAEMNQRWLGHEGPTDSIAFSFEGDPSPDGLRGEVVASAETALREARARGLDPRGELLLYVAHGVLHLLGWEDGTPRQRAAMNARARRAVRRGLRPGTDGRARRARRARRASGVRGASRAQRVRRR